MSGRSPLLTLAAPSTVTPTTPPIGKIRISLEAGTALEPDAAVEIYLILAGRVEIYANFDDGSRRFLFQLNAGGHIVTPAAAPGDKPVTAVAVEETELAALELDAISNHSPALAAIFDEWLSHFSASVARVAGPAPREITVLQAGEHMEATPGSTLTGLGGLVWLTTEEADLVYCGRAALATFEGRKIGVVTAGTWLAALSRGEIQASATAQILLSQDWPRLLTGIQAGMLALIESAHFARQLALHDAVEVRVDQTRRTVDRAFSRFDAVLGRSTQDNPKHIRDEPLVGPFCAIARALRIDLTSRQRETLARARNVDEAARAIRLRNRPLSLSADWRRQDLGPLLGFIDADRRPVALIPSGTGRWHIVEGENTKPRLLDASLAARLSPQAHMLYSTFADLPVGLRQFVAFVWPRSRRDIATAAAMSLACALLGLATPIAMQLAFDRFIPGHQISSLLVLAIGLVMAALIAAAFRFVFDIASLRVDGRSAGAIQAAIMDRVLKLPDQALGPSAGNLATRVMSADAFRRSLISLALGSTSAMFFLTTNIAWMFYYSPAAAGAAVGLFALTSAVAAYCGYHQLASLARGEEIRSDIYGITFQLVQGITALRSTGAEQRGFARWAIDFAELRSRMYRARTYATALETALVAFEIVALAIVLLVLAQLPRDNLSTGAFISFISAYGAYMGASLQIARAMVTAWNSKPSWGRIAPLLRVVPEGANTRRDPGTLSGAIDLTNVYFRYGPEAPFALQAVSLSVNPGESVALVGPSGSGKSTLMRLLLGFHMPVSGTIQYDQQDLRFLDLETVRRQIGVVLQNTTLFPGTLYENIMGVHDGTMNDAWEAARQAGLEATIKAMPMGMHTQVTESSVAFSGGQIQRLAIARALIGRPRILLLDEATSAVDNLTQGIIVESLQRLPVTRIVIAHRLNTVKNVDRIIVLDAGKIVQIGRYEELLAAKGLFANLAKRQLS